MNKGENTNRNKEEDKERRGIFRRWIQGAHHDKIVDDYNNDNNNEDDDDDEEDDSIFFLLLAISSRGCAYGSW